MTLTDTRFSVAYSATVRYFIAGISILHSSIHYNTIAGIPPFGTKGSGKTFPKRQLPLLLLMRSSHHTPDPRIKIAMQQAIPTRYTKRFKRILLPPFSYRTRTQS
jgi:hypothetical protein